MSHGRPIRRGLLSRPVVMLLVCGLLPSVVRQSDASGAVGEKDGLRRSPLHNAYIPGGSQRFPVGPIPSQHEGQLLPEAPGGKPNERRYKASLLFPDSHLIGKLDKAKWHNLGLGGLAATTAGGSGRRGGRRSKASYLQPRIFQGAGGPKEQTMVPLSPQHGAFWKPQPVAPSPLSSKSVISGESPFSQNCGKAPISDGLVSLGKNLGTINAPKLGNQAPFSRKVSQPTAPRGASEATPAGRNVNKSYLFDSDQTSGKLENVNVSGDGQHAGQGISHSTSSQNSSPLLKLASQQLSQKVHSSDVQTSVYKAMLPDPHNGGSTVLHKAQPKAFGRPSWLKSRQSVVEDENIKLPGGLGIKNFVYQKFGFGRRPEVVAAATTAPLEVELERVPQKYSISMRSANNVPSQQGKVESLQHSEFPQKRNTSKSVDKGAFGGAQPRNLNGGSKTSLQGHTSVNGKYNFGGLTGRPFRTPPSGQLEGANALATRTMGKYILKPPTNGMLPFKVAREKPQSLRQGSLQGGSAVDRSGTRTSQAEEVASPSLTQSTPDDDDEEGSLSIPVTDNHFSKRMPATSNAILVPQSPNHYGKGTISRDYMIPSASKTLTHLPSQSVRRPFEGEVRNDIEETVSVSSKTRQSENHPGLTRNAMGPNDLEVLSGIAKFPPNHATNTQSHSDLGKPYSPDFGFAGSHFSRPQLKPMVTPIDMIHTRPAPIKSNQIKYIRRVRVKGKGVKKPNLFEKILHTNILGSAMFTSAKVKSQKGSKKMVDKNEERTKAGSFSSSLWEGNSAPYPIYRHEPKLGVAGVSSEQAGQGDGRVQFSSVRGAFPDYWSGKAGHRNVLPGLGPVAKGQSSNFVDASSNFVLSAADEDWNYLKTSASNTSFKSAKVPRSVEATRT